MSELLFLKDIIILLIFAYIGGYLSRLVKQPEVLGQILFGLILGPTVLGVLESTEFIDNIAQIGVIFLMFMAGLETNLEDLKSSGKVSSFVAIGGVILPVILAVVAIVPLKDMTALNESLFLGVILSATSVSISVATLKGLNKLRSKEGTAILEGAIIDDVLGIILFTVAMSIVAPGIGESASISIVLGKVVLFFIISIIIGIFYSRIISHHTKDLARHQELIPMAIVFAFSLALLAEFLGVSAIIGAYVTGVIFSTTGSRHRVTAGVQRIGYSLFIPIFFMNIGLSVNLEGISESLVLAGVLVVISVIGKIIGSGAGAKLGGLTNKESLRVGIGMIPRGEVALIISDLGIEAGVIGKNTFTAIIIVVIVSTIVTPILLKMTYKNFNKADNIK